ncbi:hypothetical protein [Bacillus cereus]|uniref:hypothetical protein n=1 Tax=Bacillus cereus TaxID=1396 RepID=UPI001145E8B8|nr:hypothetical protein [Bacillus cereus]
MAGEMDSVHSEFLVISLTVAVLSVLVIVLKFSLLRNLIVWSTSMASYLFWRECKHPRQKNLASSSPSRPSNHLSHPLNFCDNSIEQPVLRNSG